MTWRWRRILSRICIASWFLFLATPAFAVSFFVDTGIGLSQIRNTSPFFSNNSLGYTPPSTLAYGFAGSFGTFVSTGSGRQVIELQLGVLGRLATGSESRPASYSLATAYPQLRLQISRFMLGVGYTPFVWRRVSPAWGIDAFSKVSARAMNAEFGVLLPVTPKFSFAITTCAQFITASGQRSPAPSLDGLLTFRFYLGFWGRRGGGASESSNEFKGWRYPFGQEIR